MRHQHLARTGWSSLGRMLSHYVLYSSSQAAVHLLFSNWWRRDEAELLRPLEPETRFVTLALERDT